MVSIPPSKLAFSYIRFSTPEQSKGNSLERQLEAANEYAKQHGLVLDTSLRDLGVSAYTGANKKLGALARFRERVESGDIPRGSTLLVESLDRLSREDVLTAQEYLIGLMNAGVTVVTLVDEQVFNREEVSRDWTRLMLSIVTMARAHEESATKGKRVAKAWGAKRARAAETQEALTSRCVAWCRVVGDIRRGARMELIPERAAVVRRIFEMTAAGYGRRQIASAFNREGIPTWGRGEGWRDSYIAKILDNRAVLGFNQPHRKPKRDERRTPDGPEIPGYYPPAVDEALYFRALAARTERRKKGGPKGKASAGVSNLFSTIATCAACGRRMVHVNKGEPPKGGRYLVCDSSLRGMACAAPARWRYERAERAILRGIRTLDIAAVLGQGASAADDARAKVTALRAQLEAAEQRRKRWLDVVDGSDDPEAIHRARESLAAVKALKKELAEAEKAAGMAAHRGELPDRIALIGELTDRMDAAQGQELADIRTRLAQELQRAVVRLRFTPTAIMADYKPDPGRKRGPFDLPRNASTVMYNLEDAAALAEEGEILAALAAE